MKVPRVRFTVRTQMVAVLFVAAMFGLHRGAKALRDRSEGFAALARIAEVSARQADEQGRRHSGDRRWKAVTSHQRALAETYRRVARYPFLPVAPDPPEPE